MEPRDKEKELPLVDSEEENTVTRKIMIWLNTCPMLPVNIVSYEDIQPDTENIAMSLNNGARIVEQNIIGGYTAEYQFILIYRIKPGTDIDIRLKADETLERIAQWALKNKPDLGNLKVRQIEVIDRAGIAATFEDGDEDHQITLSLQYYVSPKL